MANRATLAMSRPIHSTKRIAFIGAALLVVGCTAPVASSPTPTSIANTAAPTASSAPSPVTSPSPSPSPLGFIAGTPAQWPAVDIYALENDGNAHRYNEKGNTVVGHVCDGPRRTSTTADGRTVLGFCAGTGLGLEDVYRLIPRPELVVSGVMTSWPADLSPDGAQAVAFEEGDCPMPAPVCQTRAVLLDLATDAKREILPSNYYLGATLGWTALGLTYFQPQCAEAGCVGAAGDRDGTWVWDGARFVKQTPLRFVARNGSWELYEKLRMFNDRSQPTEVIRRGPSGDVVVTPAGSSERALAVDAAGGVLVWRTQANEGGSLVRYDAGLHQEWSRQITGTVASVAGPYVVTLDYGTPFSAQAVRLYDTDRGLLFTETPFGPRGVGIVPR